MAVPETNAAAGGSPEGPHVAIVMDGNGRWAKRRGLPRTVGHQAGVEALKRIVQACPDLGIQWLTVFGFSTENWRRPPARGRALPRSRLRICREAETRTAHNKRLFLTVAFNYGGQADIADAARKFAEDVAAGRVKPGDLDEARFASYLSTAELPPPDLIVR